MVSRIVLVIPAPAARSAILAEVLVKNNRVQRCITTKETKDFVYTAYKHFITAREKNFTKRELISVLSLTKKEHKPN